ncbi:hypothetical protein [Secundilactobacillus similis]|nr:hypothetical protein [Secundilactobacillus similis]
MFTIGTIITTAVVSSDVFTVASAAALAAITAPIDIAAVRAFSDN